MQGRPNPLSPFRGRGLGRGWHTLPPQRNLNGANHTVKISYNLTVAEPQHAIPARLQRLRASRISQLTPNMRLPINLDHQPFRASRKVSNVRRQHHLPLKLDAQLPSPQHGPKRALRPRDLGAQLLRPLPRGFVSLGHSPSPNPLPREGERANMLWSRSCSSAVSGSRCSAADFFCRRDVRPLAHSLNLSSMRFQTIADFLDPP